MPSAFVTAQQVFRSGVQIVEVDARVFGPNGEFLTGLTRDDFEILEDGIPQPLVAVTLVTAPAAPAAPADPASPAAPASPASPASPARQTWIFFFDVNHLTPGANFGRARDAAAAFVRDRFRDGDIAGVIDANGMVNGRLTSDRAEIVKAIEGVKPNADAQSRLIQMTRTWPRLLDEDEATRIIDNSRDAIEAAVCRATQDRDGRDAGCNYDLEPDVREKARLVVDSMQRPTIETLQTIDRLAAGLARMIGPKTVVFISNGFVSVGMDGPLRSIVGQMARAGGRVYSIDARGLGRFGSGDNLAQAGGTNEAGAMMSFDTQADGFNSLAVDTGGMMIRNENNFNRALDTIAADANQYYVLGYQPANTAFDGKYRSIEVRVKRPDARVRARRGYLALEPARMLVPQPLPPVESADKAEPAAGLPAPDPPAAFAEPATREETEAGRLRPDEETRVRTLSEVTGGMAGSSSADARDGWDAYQRGDLEAALPLLERAAQKADVPPWALYVLGMTRAGLGNAEAAIAAWERVRAATPDYSAVYNDLAATYASQGKLSDALGMLREAEKRWPADAEIQNGIGVILVRRQAYDEAIAAFSRATAAAPDEAVTHLNLGRAYELRYMRDLRFVASQRRWIGPENDRKKAVEAYTRCIERGGPYARRAAAALSRLEWNSRDRRE